MSKIIESTWGRPTLLCSHAGAEPVVIPSSEGERWSFVVQSKNKRALGGRVRATRGSLIQNTIFPLNASWDKYEDPE